MGEVVLIRADGVRVNGEIALTLKFDVPASVAIALAEINAQSAILAYQPEDIKIMDAGDPARCPQCDAVASTAAVQLTYQVGEPHTLHFWCPNGHTWQWDAQEGRS